MSHSGTELVRELCPILFGGNMAKVKITARPNGPYRVEDPEGLIELVDAAGTPYDLGGKTRIRYAAAEAASTNPSATVLIRESASRPQKPRCVPKTRSSSKSQLQDSPLSLCLIH